MKHDWIVSVFDDIEAYAHRNRLNAIVDAIATARVRVAHEISLTNRRDERTPLKLVITEVPIEKAMPKSW